MVLGYIPDLTCSVVHLQISLLIVQNIGLTLYFSPFGNYFWKVGVYCWYFWPFLPWVSKLGWIPHLCTSPPTQTQSLDNSAWFVCETQTHICFWLHYSLVLYLDRGYLDADLENLPVVWTHVVLNYVGLEKCMGIRTYENGRFTAADTTKTRNWYHPADGRLVVGRSSIAEDLYVGLLLS